MSIEFRPDGPHSDAYTTAVSGALAESVRVLNHATLFGSGGLAYPITVYMVVGDLAAAAGGLRQTLAQLVVFLEEEHAAGRLADERVSDLDPARAVAECAAHLELASTGAETLALALGAAQSALSGMYRPEGQS